MVVRIMIPTTRVSPEQVREFRWQNVVEEVAEYRVNNQIVCLTWETASPEVAYTQLNRLAGNMIASFQVFSDAEEQAYVHEMEARLANA